MIQIVFASLFYIALYLIDLFRFRWFGSGYRYVSWETWFLFIAGQIGILLIFPEILQKLDFFSALELIPITILTVAMLFSTYMFRVERELICTIGSRTEKCLSPLYVLVKGAEIVFQQLTYLVIAWFVAAHVPVVLYQYIIFVIILSIIHIPVILWTSRLHSQIFTFGLWALAAPTFYTHVEIGLFWPAVYVHVLLYIFYWIAFANFSGKRSG